MENGKNQIFKKGDLVLFKLNDFVHLGIVKNNYNNNYYFIIKKPWVSNKTLIFNYQAILYFRKVTLIEFEEWVNQQGASTKFYYEKILTWFFSQSLHKLLTCAEDWLRAFAVKQLELE